MGKLTAAIRVADEVWIATALLHRERPRETDFSLKDIAARIEREGLTDDPRAGIYPASVGPLRREPAAQRRHLSDAVRERLRRDDGFSAVATHYHPKREGGKTAPERDQIPGKYHRLLDWYEREWTPAQPADPLIALADRHQDLWTGVDADVYVRSLREGFE